MRFMLNVTSTSREVSGLATLELQPAPPRPSNGSCTALVEGDVWPAVSLVDRVVVSCYDWTDHSDTASPLDYHVFVNDSAADDRGRFDWYPVYRGSRNDVAFHVSPLRGGSRVVDVYVDIIDSLGSTRRALHASVLSLAYLVRITCNIKRNLCCTVSVCRISYFSVLYFYCFV